MLDDSFPTLSLIHILYPKAYLKTQGIIDLRDTNQIANYAIVEWNDNSAISDTDPKEYVPQIVSRFTPQEIKKMYYWHGLPDNWEEMDYKEFLTVSYTHLDVYKRQLLNYIHP